MNKKQFNFTTHKEIWTAKITSKEQAATIINVISISFFLLAGLYVIIGFLNGIDFIINGIIVAVLSFLLRRFNSRIVAIIFLLLASYSLIYAFLSGINWYVSYLLVGAIFWASIRAIQSTFALHKFSGKKK